MKNNKPYSSGSIIGTASVAGIRSNAGGSEYSASKAAVASLMQTCAYQLAGTGIRCNALGMVSLFSKSGSANANGLLSSWNY